MSLKDKWKIEAKSSVPLRSCLNLFGEPGRIDIGKVLDPFSLFLNVIHVNAVSDSHMVTGPLENLVRAHFSFNIHQ